MQCSVSVAMATFNGEKYIIEQLESLARQTLLPAELIITDDGSTDKTVDLIQGFVNQLNFPVRLVKNEARLGYGRNFMKAASLSQSEYVAFCDQDDVWHIDKISIVNAVACKKEYDLIVHGGRVVDASLTELGEFFPIVAEGVIKLDNYSKFFFPGNVMTIKRDFLMMLNYESRKDSDGKSFAHDLWICGATLQRGTCYGVNTPLISYRQHDSNVIGFSELVNSESYASTLKVN